MHITTHIVKNLPKIYFDGFDEFFDKKTSPLVAAEVVGTLFIFAVVFPTVLGSKFFVKTRE